MKAAVSLPQAELSPQRERALLWVLAFLQFTHVTDFVILMPLGPSLLRSFDISATAFASLVSAYTYSAAFFSLGAALYLDRWPRKTLLVAVYIGFLLGTLLCGLSGTYGQFLGARIVAGAFGGTVNTLAFALVADWIPAHRRGRAMGVLMAAFSIATVVGLPLGLWIAAQWHWPAVFYSISALGVGALVLLVAVIPPGPVQPHWAGWGARLREFQAVLSVGRGLWGLALVMVVMGASFVIIPMLSPSLVFNVGISEADLAWVYFAGGVCTFFSSQFIGRLCDRHGALRVFTVLAVASMAPMLVATHLAPMPLWQVLPITTVFMILLSGRMVPTMTILSGLVPPARRGGYMSLVTFFQQLAMGSASLLSGFLVHTSATGRLENYPRAGYVAVALSLCALAIAHKLRAKALPN